MPRGHAVTAAAGGVAQSTCMVAQTAVRANTLTLRATLAARHSWVRAVLPRDLQTSIRTRPSLPHAGPRPLPDTHVLSFAVVCS